MFSQETSLKEWVNWALQENAASEIVAFGLLPGDVRHLSAKDQCVSPVFRVAVECLTFAPDMVAAIKKIRATLYS